ncbi:MAG: DUF2071 domain-containing protein [Bacteriovoracaceae bacterium]
MIKLFSLSFILFVAGLVHLIRPEVFLPAIPLFISFPYEVIYLTGILEIILAVGLIRKKTQDMSAKIVALYFFILVPVHIYVALMNIEIFGIQSPALLWGRTFFQFVFIFWALSLQTKGWIIEQKWKNVFFIHYKIDPRLIAHLVPFKLDLHEGKAVISIVPFLMEGIRFPFLPSVPKVSKLWELNIRTYVEVNGVKGVYFFTLETDSKLGEIIARQFFHLPYRYSKIKAQVTKEYYEFDHQRADYHFSLRAMILKRRRSNEFDHWTTERYSLFTKNGDKTYQGIVEHAPWRLRDVNLTQIGNNFTTLVTDQYLEFAGASFSRYLKVRFRPFRPVKNIV